MPTSTYLRPLVAVAFFLPVAVTVLVAVARLLEAMADAAAATVLGWIAFACAICWGLDLVAIVLVQALDGAFRRGGGPRTDEPERDEP